MPDAPPDRELARRLGDAWLPFVDAVEPFRADLFAFARRLAGSPFDAEDLVHEALLRAFGTLGIGEGKVGSLRGYLFRTLSNLWIDELRRRRPLAEPGEEAAPADPAPTPEDEAGLRDAGPALGALAPRERVALVLKEAFDLPHARIAEILQSSEGAVKVALHRGRRRLDAPPAAAARPRVSSELVDRFVAAFRAHDVEALKDLLAPDAEAEVFPSGIGWGRDHHAERGWLHGALYHHVPEREARREPYPLRLEPRELFGERVLLVFRDPEGEGEALEEVWLFEEVEGRIARVRDYGFCPDLVRHVAEACGVPFRAVGYRYRPGVYRDPEHPGPSA